MQSLDQVNFHFKKNILQKFYQKIISNPDGAGISHSTTILIK